MARLARQLTVFLLASIVILLRFIRQGARDHPDGSSKPAAQRFLQGLAQERVSTRSRALQDEDGSDARPSPSNSFDLPEVRADCPVLATLPSGDAEVSKLAFIDVIFSRDIALLDGGHFRIRQNGEIGRDIEVPSDDVVLLAGQKIIRIFPAGRTIDIPWTEGHDWAVVGQTYGVDVSEGSIQVRGAGDGAFQATACTLLQPFTVMPDSYEAPTLVGAYMMEDLRVYLSFSEPVQPGSNNVSIQVYNTPTASSPPSLVTAVSTIGSGEVVIALTFDTQVQAGSGTFSIVEYSNSEPERHHVITVEDAMYIKNNVFLGLVGVRPSGHDSYFIANATDTPVLGLDGQPWAGGIFQAFQVDNFEAALVHTTADEYLCLSAGLSQSISLYLNSFIAAIEGRTLTLASCPTPSSTCTEEDFIVVMVTAPNAFDSEIMLQTPDALAQRYMAVLNGLNMNSSGYYRIQFEAGTFQVGDPELESRGAHQMIIMSFSIMSESNSVGPYDMYTGWYSDGSSINGTRDMFPVNDVDALPRLDCDSHPMEFYYFFYNCIQRVATNQHEAGSLVMVYTWATYLGIERALVELTCRLPNPYHYHCVGNITVPNEYVPYPLQVNRTSEVVTFEQVHSRISDIICFQPLEEDLDSCPANVVGHPAMAGIPWEYVSGLTGLFSFNFIGQAFQVTPSHEWSVREALARTLDIESALIVVRAELRSAATVRVRFGIVLRLDNRQQPLTDTLAQLVNRTDPADFASEGPSAARGDACPSSLSAFECFRQTLAAVGEELAGTTMAVQSVFHLSVEFRNASDLNIPKDEPQISEEIEPPSSGPEVTNRRVLGAVALTEVEDEEQPFQIDLPDTAEDFLNISLDESNTSITAGVATRFVFEELSPIIVLTGSEVELSIVALDGFGDVAVQEQRDVTVVMMDASWSQERIGPQWLVDISNGRGSFSIVEDLERNVVYGLLDTMETGLQVDSTLQVHFQAPPAVAVVLFASPRSSSIDVPIDIHLVAVDDMGTLVASETSTFEVLASGPGTVEPSFVTLEEGVGGASVSSTSAADVQVSLRDSNMTGLNVTSTVTLTFFQNVPAQEDASVNQASFTSSVEVEEPSSGPFRNTEDPPHFNSSLPISSEDLGGAGVAIRFAFDGPSVVHLEVGTLHAISVVALDAFGYVADQEQRDVSLTTVSPTGEVVHVLVDIINGRQDITFIWYKPINITYWLTDTEGTGLQVDGTQELIIRAGPAVHVFLIPDPIDSWSVRIRVEAIDSYLNIATGELRTFEVVVSGRGRAEPDIITFKRGVAETVVSSTVSGEVVVTLHGSDMTGLQEIPRVLLSFPWPSTPVTPPPSMGPSSDSMTELPSISLEEIESDQLESPFEEEDQAEGGPDSYSFMPSSGPLSISSTLMSNTHSTTSTSATSTSTSTTPTSPSMSSSTMQFSTTTTSSSSTTTVTDPVSALQELEASPPLHFDLSICDIAYVEASDGILKVEAPGMSSTIVQVPSTYMLQVVVGAAAVLGYDGIPNQEDVQHPVRFVGRTGVSSEGSILCFVVLPTSVATPWTVLVLGCSEALRVSSDVQLLVGNVTCSSQDFITRNDTIYVIPPTPIQRGPASVTLLSGTLRSRSTGLSSFLQEATLQINACFSVLRSVRLPTVQSGTSCSDDLGEMAWCQVLCPLSFEPLGRYVCSQDELVGLSYCVEAGFRGIRLFVMGIAHTVQFEISLPDAATERELERLFRTAVAVALEVTEERVLQVVVRIADARRLAGEREVMSGPSSRALQGSVRGLSLVTMRYEVLAPWDVRDPQNITSCTASCAALLATVSTLADQASTTYADFISNLNSAAGEVFGVVELVAARAFQAEVRLVKDANGEYTILDPANRYFEEQSSLIIKDLGDHNVVMILTTAFLSCCAVWTVAGVVSAITPVKLWVLKHYG